jgi:hypothetical protein
VITVRELLKNVSQARIYLTSLDTGSFSKRTVLRGMFNIRKGKIIARAVSVTSS